MWEDEEEYRRCVQPLANHRHESVRITHGQTWFSCQEHLQDAFAKIRNATHALRSLKLRSDQQRDPARLTIAREHAQDIAYWGEQLLLYHKRLACSDHAYDFLHAHDMVEHWERYAATPRILRELDQLVLAADKLIAGYHQLQQEDEAFLDHLDLPSALRADFLLCRNLVSIGLDDIGVFAASRGLEGVLRAIARKRTDIPGERQE